jgi:hypothetical protein
MAKGLTLVNSDEIFDHSVSAVDLSSSSPQGESSMSQHVTAWNTLFAALSNTQMASSSRPPITFSVLEKYFTVVKDLRDYLSEILEFGDGSDSHLFLPQVTDSTAYRDLIDTSYVASKSPDAQNPNVRFKPFQPAMYMREVSWYLPMMSMGVCDVESGLQIIDKVQECLFNRAKGKPSNLITSGYRLVSKDSLSRFVSGFQIK